MVTDVRTMSPGKVEPEWNPFTNKPPQKQTAEQRQEIVCGIPVSSDWKRVIYIAGAYRAATEWEQAVNISHAGFIARELWKRGWAVICPHKNTAYFGGLLEDPDQDATIWLTGDLELLRRCDAIYMLKGFEQSKGAMLEYNKAMELGMPMYFESKGDLLT